MPFCSICWEWLYFCICNSNFVQVRKHDAEGTWQSEGSREMPVSDEFSQRAQEVGDKQSWGKAFGDIIFLDYLSSLFQEGHPQTGHRNSVAGKTDGKQEERRGFLLVFERCCLRKRAREGQTLSCNTAARVAVKVTLGGTLEPKVEKANLQGRTIFRTDW